MDQPKFRLSPNIPPSSSARSHARSGTFVDNMKLPIHRWFRYSAGFSADWVVSVVSNETRSEPIHVLDPFCGSGTTLIAAASCGSHSVGLENHPFVAKIARAKLRWSVDLDKLRRRAERLLEIARGIKQSNLIPASDLLKKCYDQRRLSELDSLRSAYITLNRNGGAIDDLVWIAITSILRQCSFAGTAQWQYVLPKKRKARVDNPYRAFMDQINVISKDLLIASQIPGSARILQTDARCPDLDGIFDLVITSPPYPNNYDYADATRLEMTFWREVTSWSDLHPVVRRHLIRSCSQHAAAEKLSLSDLLPSKRLDPIRNEVELCCSRLGEIRKTKGGKKTYHTMVAAYFVDLANVFVSLRAHVKKGGTVFFMVGDSAPYGVYVPSDEWLGRLAIAAGFKSYEFQKIRDRNIKWKNRKHRVPLKEGVLRIQG